MLVPPSPPTIIPFTKVLEGIEEQLRQSYRSPEGLYALKQEVEDWIKNGVAGEVYHIHWNHQVLRGELPVLYSRCTRFKFSMEGFGCADKAGMGPYYSQTVQCICDLSGFQIIAHTNAIAELFLQRQGKQRYSEYDWRTKMRDLGFTPEFIELIKQVFTKMCECDD